MKKQGRGALLLTLNILIALAMNWAGRQLASGQGWPIWLDSVGTVLCAYLLGPVCGALVGATSNLLAHILYGVSPWYALVSIVIGIVTGICARKKMLEKMLGVMNTCAILTGSVAAVAYALNLILNSSGTGNRWGDAVMAFLAEHGFPRWGGMLAGELYVELLDKFLILLALFLIIRLARLVRKWTIPLRTVRETAAKVLERTLAVLLAVGLGIAALGGPGDPARAAGPETDEVTDVSVQTEGTETAGAADDSTKAADIETAGGEDASAKTTGADVSSAADYQDYVQTIYSTTNGLPCGEANDIAMTEDGIMWIGTYAGLYRYNGREFRWMDSFDSVRNVNCLYCDEEGRLWIGTNDNGLSIMINEQVVNVIDQDQGLPANSVKSIIKSADGYYYIGTTGSMQVLTLSGGLKQMNVLSEVIYADRVAADQTGYVAAVSNDGILYLLRQGQVVLSRRNPEGAPAFRSCVFTPEGDLLAGTTGGEIYRFRITREGLEQTETILCEGLENIKTMYWLENGEMFVCADNGIACRTASGGYERINTNDFNNSIDHMLRDYQGNLWFTSSRLGLLRLAPSDFRDIYGAAGMDHRVVNAIVEWNGVYYIGTDKGLDAVDREGKRRITDGLTERFDGMRIRCLLVDRDNHLWVCTYSEGLVERTPEGAEYLYNHENGAFGNQARVATQLADGTVVAAGNTGLSFIRDHQVVRTINRSGGQVTSMVLSILEREDGTVLAGTDGNGIALLENGEVSRLMTRADGLSSEVILRLIQDPGDGGIFVVTSNGLCYMDREGSIRTLNNFPYYNCYDIWSQGTDTLFVLSSAGIYRVNRAELLSGMENISYDLLDNRRGLSGSLTANAWTWYSKESGELFLPCDTGVFVLNAEGLSSGAAAYRMKVAGVRTNGVLQRTERGTATRIPRESSRVEILPEIINYTIQEPYVGYMLEGFESEWNVLPLNSLGSVIYTNLPVGDFTFHLAVFDNDQKTILTERVYRLTKEKEIYDNGWFIGYLLLVPMFSVFWITWLLVKRHEQKMQEELERANLQVEMGKQTVIAIARTVDAKDERTSEHSKRVAIYSEQIAKASGLDQKQCNDIRWAAQMHDIGKIAIPDRILNKDSRLTDEEYAIMKTHTTKGAKILEGFTLLDHVIEGAKYHHERFDGRGYPQGLKGMDIPMYARIIGVADAFDAMTANRVYRKQMDFSYVLGELEKGRGTQFDPVYVDLLLKLIHEGTINLNKIYHVSEEASAQAEKAAAEARAAKEAETKTGAAAPAAEPGRVPPEKGGQA